MAFLYPDKKPEELSNAEIVQDILQTQDWITAVIRSMVDIVKATDYSKRYRAPLEGRALFEILIDVWPKLFIDCEEKYRDLDLDLAHAWDKYEHFPRYGITDEDLRGNSRRWLIDKYEQYNRCVMPYYDFFMKMTDEERLTKLRGTKNK